jgi:hypothetical protein
MATHTRIELRNAVMHDLAVLAANAAPSAEDAVLVDSRVQSRLELLNDDGLIPFDLDGGAIPARYLVPLVQVIGPSLLGAFGLLAEKPQRDADAREGMKALRRLKAAPYFGTPAKADYF